VRAMGCYGPGPRIITSPTSPQDGTRYTDPLRCVVCISLELKSAWFQSRSLQISRCKEPHCGARLGAVVQLCPSCTTVSAGSRYPPSTQYCSTEDGVEWNGKSLSVSALNTLAATLLR